MNSKPELSKGVRRGSLFRFRQWPVYRAAKEFRKRIRALARSLPEEERYLLASQISRAADEVVCCLDLILDDGHITGDVFDGYVKEAEGLGAQLIAFGRKVRAEGTRL